MLGVVLPDGTDIDYVVDALGRRVAKKVDGVLVRQWTYQFQRSLLAEYDGAGNLIQQFVYATRVNVPDLIIRGGTTYRVIADQVGSVRRVVEANSGAVVQKIAYSPFGRVLSDSSPGWQPFAFAGGHYDQDTGLVRFGARDYDAEVGRWTAKDPTLFQADSNLYSYSYSNPINYVDINGEHPIIIVLILAGGITLANPSTAAAPATAGATVHGPTAADATLGIVKDAATYPVRNARLLCEVALMASSASDEFGSPEAKAERDHDRVRDELRKENEGYESGRHNEYPRSMSNELDRLADEADARGDLPEYGERLREIAETYKKRAQAGHPGGRRR